MGEAEKRSISVAEALQLVRQLRQAGRIKKAAQVCQRILQADPSNADALFHLGTIELQVGAFSQAADHLRCAAELRPQNAVSLHALGAAEEAANRYGAAIEAYQRAINAGADDGELHHGLASAFLKAGRIDEALASARLALRLSGNAATRHLLAQILQQQGNYEESLACHREALRENSEVRRCQVVQAVIAWKRATTYLEIGVDTGDNLQFIHAPTKIAVDPIPAAAKVRSEVAGGRAQYFEMTSDRFFTEHATLFAERPVDVAFVDGLHTHAQALRDVENCLQCLSDGGVIIMHDCNPTTEAMALPAASYEEAVEMRQPGESTDWTGDVWKAIVHLRAHCQHVSANVLDCDFGVGVVVKRPAREQVAIGNVESLSYDDLAANRVEYLGSRQASELWELLGEPELSE